MLINLILFLTMLAYSVIVSQSFMYILSLRHMQVNLQATEYIAVRKLIDAGMNSRFRYVFYVALLLSLLLVVVCAFYASGLLFISACIAFVALVADTIITVKGNLPINAEINSWTKDQFPNDWGEYRIRWLTFYQYRQILNITGFVCLVAGVVFG